MNTAPLRNQQGMGLIAVFLLGALAVVLVTLGLRVLPAVLEYQSVQKAVRSAAATNAGGTVSAAEIQRAFDRQAVIDDITAVKGTDLLIERTGSRAVVSVRYEKRVALFGPVSLLIEFSAASAP
jgi:hypothetical protein